MARWWAEVDDIDLFVSVLTLGEIRRGCEAVRPRDPDRAARLEVWLAEVTEAFGPRVLGVDGRVADAWGRMAAVRTVSVIDGLLAATARVHGLTLVTRNTRDFEGLDTPPFNPFDA